MTQRSRRKAYVEGFEKQDYSPLIAEQLAEGMVKAAKSEVIDRGARWDLMKFLICLANADVRQLRAGDILNLQEDFINMFRPFSIGYAPPTVDEFEGLQKILAKHLDELMNEGTTVLGPFESKMIATRQTVNISKSEVTTIFHCMNLPTSQPEKFLIHEFAKLLEKYGSLLGKCPHCGRIFLQLRKNAIYCDRKCQRVAVMRKIRAKPIKAPADNKKQKTSGGNERKARC